MAITLPSTDPVEHYYRRLSPGRMILVENTSRPWAVERTRWLARRKRIPAANIVSVALGDTSYYYDPGDNQGLWDDLLEPIRDLAASLGAQGVFLGPGCPDMVVITGQYLGSGSAESVVMLTDVVAGAPYIGQWIDDHGVSALKWANTANGNYAFLDAGGGTTPVNTGNLAQMLTGTVASLYPTYVDQWTGANAETIYLPTQTSLDLLGDAGNAILLGGKFGIAYSRSAYVDNAGGFPDQLAESAALDGKLLDAAIKYGEGLNPANRYQHPIHLQFGGYSNTYQSLCYLAQQLDGWGYNVSYAWRTTPLAEPESYAPAAGSAYTLADLQEGRVRDIPYHVMMGDASNQEMAERPFNTAWQPSPGGGSWLGPSEGWLYCLNGLTRGGGAGASNGLHITASVYLYAYTVLHNLLRGMCWAEAVYYSGYASQGAMFAVGDPLLTPFPRADV